jgi:cytoskeletal protein RodZ
MGFPEWTLIGMGLSAVGALLALILAYIGQSPQFLNRSGLKRARLDLRVRALTSYAIALLILAIGFFLAGVPLDSQPESNSMESQSPEDGTAVSDESSSSFDDVAVSSTSPTVASTPATPETGAFAGPPEPTEPSEEASVDTAEVITSTVANSTLAPDFPTAPDEASATPSATPSPTPTATPTPTQTPTPTLTPTPISGETAVVNSGGNMVWLRRSPGGQDLVLVNDNEILLLLPGHANQGGQLWQEVSTLEGVAGWILEDLLELPEE